jgi:THO complex subunit 2
MAAPLESGTPPSKAKATPESPRKVSSDSKETTCQTVGLLNALLTVGALRPAVAILTRYPWMVDAHPELADLIIRILKVSLSSLYESTFVTKERNQNFTFPRARYGASGVTFPPPRKPLLTLWAPTPPSTSTTDFVFFFPNWSDRVPICSSLDDLIHVVEPLMHFVGLHISRDPLFLTKFLRLGRTHLVSTV